MHREDDPATVSSEPRFVVSRRVYTRDEFDKQYPLAPQPERSLRAKLRETCKCSKTAPWKLLTTYLPIVKYIQKYKLREYIIGDVLSGVTVSFMHLPLSLGLGILANLRPEHGLYTTFFSVLFYTLFGTSPYVSFGTNAVLALLTQTVVTREADAFAASYKGVVGNASGNSTADIQAFGPSEAELLAVRTNAAAGCCLMVGIFLTGLGLLRFGFLTTYMSDSFIGGFTTAAAIHIATSQVPRVFGIKAKSYSGAGKVILTYIDLFKNIEQTIIAEVIIAVSCMATLLLVKICVNERYAKKMKMPIPIDLIVVVVGTFTSHFARFEENFSVTIAGDVPSSFAAPFVPDLTTAGNYISDAFVMAILSLTMSISIAKLTATLHNIEIDDNQELVAYGASNLLSGFFSCFPTATAPPRAMILSSLGAKTTLNGIPTSVIMLLIILAIGPLFVALPLSVLAAMIIVAMKDLLLQYRNLPNIWRVNRYDFAIWVTTNSIGVLVDLNYGLIAGLAISIFLVVVQTQRASGSVLVRSQTEDLLIDRTRSKSAEQSHGYQIFRFETGLYFATRERFKSELYRKLLDPKLLKKTRNKEKELHINAGFSNANSNGDAYTCTVSDEINMQSNDVNKTCTINPNTSIITSVILDCSAICYMDIGGKAMLQQVIKDYTEIGIDVILAAIPKQAFKVLETSGFFKTFPRENLFLDLTDAVEYVARKENVTLTSEVHTPHRGSCVNNYHSFRSQSVPCIKTNTN